MLLIPGLKITRFPSPLQHLLRIIQLLILVFLDMLPLHDLVPLKYLPHLLVHLFYFHEFLLNKFLTVLFVLLSLGLEFCHPLSV